MTHKTKNAPHDQPKQSVHSNTQNFGDTGNSNNDKQLIFVNAPNILTVLRIAIVPAVVALLYNTSYLNDWLAAILFIIASITDYFDGYLARIQKAVTIYGKLLDPLADKFLIISSLIILQHLTRIHPVIVILLICRELAITGLRALATTEGLVIQASSLAKWKTASQMVAIPMLMVKEPLFGIIPIFQIGVYLIYVSLGISLWSAKDYIFDFFKEIRKKRLLKKQL